MNSTQEDIVERLELRAGELRLGSERDADLDLEAATTIETLRKKVEEAREALIEIEQHCHIETRQGLLAIVTKARAFLEESTSSGGEK